MKHGQLFAGIGGFGLAAQWAGLDNVWANEIDPFCCNVLRKNFPKIKVYEKDIRDIGKHNLEPVDIISGGFPCQPFSQAGKRKGTDDNRYLWPEMCRIIRELQPTYVIGENVAGLLSMENGETLKEILLDLENEGYHNEVFLIPTCAVGGWHRRDRLWIVCYAKHNGPSHGYKEAGGENARSKQGGMCEPERAGTQPKYVPNTNSSRHIHGEPKEQSAEGGGQSLNKPSSSSTHEDVSDTDSRGLEGASTKGERTEYAERDSGEGRKDATDSNKQRPQGGKEKGNDKESRSQSGYELTTRCSGAESGSAKSELGRVAHGISSGLDRFIPTPSASDSARGPGKHYNPESKRQSDRTLVTYAKKAPVWENEPDIPRVATGIKSRVDRLKSLGNAIVPQLAYELFEVIKKHSDDKSNT